MLECLTDPMSHHPLFRIISRFKREPSRTGSLIWTYTTAKGFKVWGLTGKDGLCQSQPVKQQRDTENEHTHNTTLSSNNRVQFVSQDFVALRNVSPISLP